MNDEDGVGEVIVIPVGLRRLLEFRGSEVAEAVDLVVHGHSKDFGMLDDIHSRLGCGRSGDGRRYEICRSRNWRTCTWGMVLVSCCLGTAMGLPLSQGLSGHRSTARRAPKDFLRFGLVCRSNKFDGRLWGLGSQKVVEVIEVVHHELHDFRVIAVFVGFIRPLSTALNRLQLDGPGFALLPHVSIRLGKAV